MPWSITNKARKTISAILLALNIMAAAIAIVLLSISVSTKSTHFRASDTPITPNIHPTLSISIIASFLMLILHATGAKLVFDVPRTCTQSRALCLTLMNPWLILLCLSIFPSILLAILTPIERSRTGRSTERDVRSAMGDYATDVKKKAFVDELQITLRCCGIESYEDWYSIVWVADKFADDAWEVFDGFTDSVPFSCCDPTSFGPCIHHRLTQPAKHNRKDVSVYTRGCAHYLVQSMRRIYLCLCAGFAVAAILQVVIFVFARYLFTSVTSLRANNDPWGVGVGHLYGSPRDRDRSRKNSRCDESSVSELSPTSSEQSVFSRLRGGGPRGPQGHAGPPIGRLPSLRPVFPTNHRRNLSPMF